MTKWNVGIAALIVASLASTTPAHAATISAYELIQDVSTSNTDLVRNLTRTRQIDANPADVETVDATIIADNAVSGSFGLFDSNDVTYAHDLSWLVPPAVTYTYAKLTITAYDVNGANDTVFADLLALGVLANGNNTVTTTAFDDANVLLSIVNNVLSVSIVKQGENDGAQGAKNGLNVLSSRLDVTYSTEQVGETVAVVPEPATMLLVATGLVAGARRSRRRR